MTNVFKQNPVLLFSEEWRPLNFFLLCHFREACPRPDRGAGIR